METTKQIKNEISTAIDDNLDSAQKKIIAKSTAKASTIAALPIPVLDMAGVVYVQVNMIRKLAKSYNVEIEQEGRLLIFSILTTIGSKLVSEAVSSLAVSTNVEKIFGESLIKATISGYLTTVVGDVYNKQLRKGADVEQIGLNAFIDHFSNQVKSDNFSVSNISGNLIETALDKAGL